MMYAKNQVNLSTLNQLVRNANHPEIKTLEVLLVKLFGRKSTAVNAFRRLMHWLPYAKREDGAIYKSAKELAEETGHSSRSMERAVPLLEEVAFDVFLKKANGAPTNHFLLNLNKLLTSLASVFSTTIEEIRAWMFGDESAPAAQIPESIVSGKQVEDSPVAEINLVQTTPTTIEAPQPVTLIKPGTVKWTEEQLARIEEIDDMRAKLNTTTSMVESWIGKHGIERVREVMREGEGMLERGEIYKSLFGWVRSQLDHSAGWQPKKKDPQYAETDGRRYLTGPYADFIER